MTSSAAVSMTSDRSPPSPRPTSTARSAVVAVAASMSRRPAVARRQTASQSSADGAIGPYSRTVPELPDGLTPAQRRVVAHGSGPLLVLGGPGTGKTRTLVARFAWLVETGTRPEAILALTFSTAAADALRARVEDAIDRAYEELAVTTVHGFCARLLRDEAAAAGLDPFAQPVTPADRLAMLLERIDELTLRRHDLRGNPAALL